MARNREAVLLLIDVGPKMHKALSEIEKLGSMLVEKKLIYNKSDEVGIVLFGTEDTKNELTDEVGGYEHIVVLQNLKVVDGGIVDSLQRIPRGTASGDFLDALVVGMDILIKKFGPTNKGKKRLCLLTSAQCPIKDPYDGTKADQVNMIASQMAAHGMSMDCVVVRGNLIDTSSEKIMVENDFLLSIFRKKACAKIAHVESPTSLLGALKTRRIAPVTIFRGVLELTPNMKIMVWVYKKTSEERLPTLRMYSDKAPPTDRFASHEVKMDFEYRSLGDPSKAVPPEQRIKGYQYGPQVIPISSAEWEAVKFKPEKGVKLLGFTDASNIMRHYHMKDTCIFIAEPGNAKAIVAVSAIARAMMEMNKVAIVRCVWRQGLVNVVVGVLTPNISHDGCIPDSFYFNVLPFAEDIREFQFPSFGKFPSSWQPTKEQQEVSDNLVKLLDLAPVGKEETLQPDLTPNPILARFYQHLDLKSKDADAALAPADEALKRITDPDPKFFAENQSVINAFCSNFMVQENVKLKKSGRRLMQERRWGSNAENDVEIPTNSHDRKAAVNASDIDIDKIGKSTPVKDFELMMQRRDDPNCISKAITDMKSKIFDLLENSSSGDSHERTLDCLVSLRRGCVTEQEPKIFNGFLNELGRFCHERKLENFIGLLAIKEIIPITKTEAADSDVGEDEVKNFLIGTELNL